MKLAEFLEKSEWTKSQVARKCGVGRSALTKWDEVPEKYVGILTQVLEGAERPPEIPKTKIGDLSHDEFGKIVRTRSHYRDKNDMPMDWVLCEEFGWRVYEFRAALEEWARVELT